MRSGANLLSFDPASLAILEQLNYAVQLLENQGQNLARIEQQGPLSPRSAEDARLQFPQQLQATPQSNDLIEESPRGDGQMTDDVGVLVECLEVAANCSSGPILEWPVFQGRFSRNDIDTSFFDPTIRRQSSIQPRDAEYSSSPTSSARHANPGRGVREEDVNSLIRDFLIYVHIKNPILDTVHLISTARQMAEHGFGWDGESCLVLIACALANLSAPFSIDRPEDNDSSSRDARDYSTAEAYFTASRKRIGLLENSVVATQCHFLIGVYAMYSMRPLQAWLSFNHACTAFQTYLRTRPHPSLRSRSSIHLEQRLYWSCLKSEFEMRDEIELPPTGLAKFEYPDIFPSPPGGTPGPDESDPQAISPPALEPELQRSWYYYLSEIASRRKPTEFSTASTKQARSHGSPSPWPACSASPRSSTPS